MIFWNIHVNSVDELVFSESWKTHKVMDFDSYKKEKNYFIPCSNSIYVQRVSLVREKNCWPRLIKPNPLCQDRNYLILSLFKSNIRETNKSSSLRRLVLYPLSSCPILSVLQN